MSFEYLIKPRESQLRAMKEIYRTKRRLIWGVPGTGKTKLAIDFTQVMFANGKAKRALIICPGTALGVWEHQIEMNCHPETAVQFFVKDGSEPDLSQDGMIVTNYDYFRPRRKKRIATKGRNRGKKIGYINRDRLQSLLEWEPEIVIIDEGHKIKNPYSRSAKAVHKFSNACEFAIDLTGTPKGNKKFLDLWSQFHFLKPGLLGDHFNDFKDEYCVYGGFNGFKFKKFKNIDKLVKLIKPYITVIKKKGQEKKDFIVYPVYLPEEAKKLYKEMEKEFIITVEKKDITAPIALAKLTKLQQISGGFIIGNDKTTYDLHRSKLEAAIEIVEDLKESGVDRIIVFARFIWEIEQLCKCFPQWTTYKITGDETPAERKLAESLFNESGGIAICQIATGSVALSFEKCDYGIFYSVDHSVINFTQALYRIDRDEQTKECTYYLIQAKGTVDARIYRNLREHRSIAKDLMGMVQEIKNARNS